MEIKWYGTASLSIKSNNESLLFDPFVPLPGSKINVSLDDYISYDNIIITHGHFDHIGSLKKIYKKNNNIKIYCTITPYNTLVKKGIPKDNLIIIKPGDVLCFDDFKITVYQGRHVVYDRFTVLKIFLRPKTYLHIYNAPFMIRENARCKENGETLFFDVEVENKHINIMGSIGYDEKVDYPKGCDLLVLPYQGKKDLLTPARKIIDIIKPKCIMLDHFDDSFPPVSKNVDTGSLEEYLNGNIGLIKPNYKEIINI